MVNKFVFTLIFPGEYQTVLLQIIFKELVQCRIYLNLKLWVKTPNFDLDFYHIVM